MADIAIIYRYAQGGNGKRRPAFFSKELALASFLRSVRTARDAGVDVEVHFLVDGGAPEPVLATMRDAGQLLLGSFGSNRASYLEQIRLVTDGSVDAGFVWFSEDDYLYADTAFVELAAAVVALPGVDYLALTNSTIVERLECRRAQTEVAVPPLPVADPRVRGRRWRAIASTTSTFGARRAALVEDARILRAAPWSGAAWDRTTLLTVQGLRPYPWRSITRDLVVASSPRRHRLLRSGWKLVTRAGLDLLSVRPTGRRRALAAPPRELIAHLELPFEADEERWLAAGRRAAVVGRDEYPALFAGIAGPERVAPAFPAPRRPASARSTPVAGPATGR